MIATEPEVATQQCIRVEHGYDDGKDFYRLTEEPVGDWQDVVKVSRVIDPVGKTQIDDWKDIYRVVMGKQERWYFVR